MISLISCDIFLTYRCNLNCLHCFIPEELRNSKTINWIKNWVDLENKLKQENVIEVRLVGGEPTIYKKLPHLYRLISKSGFFISITTNLVNIDNNLCDVMMSFPPRHVRVTLLGSSNRTYTKIAGYPYFDRVVNNIDRLDRIGIKISILYPLLKHNSHELEDVAHYCDKNKIKLTIITDFLPKLDGTKDNTLYQLSKDEIDKHLGKIKNRYVFSVDKRIKSHCTATLGNSFTIMADGKKTNCPFYNVCE